MEEQGVLLDAFSQAPSKRSKTVLLIKNLPVKTPIEEIRDMFAKHGELGRVVLPPNGVTGLVEFYEASEARSAFRRLAYTKYKGAPLYLEWAPEGSLKPKERHDNVDAPSEIAEKNEDTIPTDTGSLSPEDNATLFVKNINFESVDDELKSHFENVIGANSVYSASISRYITALFIIVHLMIT